jgi:TRAP-type mannitol/chloroaromatic compound transport system permease large subunit
VAPTEINIVDIYRGVVPFVIMQLGLMILLAVWPGLATWLPSVLRKF